MSFAAAAPRLDEVEGIKKRAVASGEKKTKKFHRKTLTDFSMQNEKFDLEG